MIKDYWVRVNVFGEGWRALNWILAAILSGALVAVAFVPIIFAVVGGVMSIMLYSGIVENIKDMEPPYSIYFWGAMAICIVPLYILSNKLYKFADKKITYNFPLFNNLPSSKSKE